MPEIKNTFVQGKMNKDLDERLLPNGQYKDAMNVQVSTSEGSNVGTVQNVLGNQSIGGISGNCVGSIADEKNNKLYWFIKTDNKDAIYEYSEGSSPEPIFIDTKVNTDDAVLEFPDRIITGINIIDDFIFWTDGVTEPKKISITRSKLGTIDAFTHTKLVIDNQLYVDTYSGQSTQVDIEKSHITVIKKKPTSKLNVEVVSTTTTAIPSLFEKTLSRFSYRYKYEDGEYSAFGPFTDTIFNPLYPDGVDQSNFFLPKEPYNLAMLNTIESINVYDFIGPDTPEDVVQVDILYKQENSPVVYSIASIKPTDATGYWDALGYSQGEGFSQNSLYRGSYPITSENIYAAVPENQLLRVYDNVPKSALSQEITGSRIVYGNYKQNYNIEDATELQLSFGPRLNFVPNINQAIYDFSDQGLRSIKSQRNYQLGVVFGDEYGRETPVFSSTESAIKIPWGGQGDLQASKSNQLKAFITSNYPSWADYYKFYIKHTSSEYYNLVMDRAYTPVEYAEGRDNFDHLWISFASSDRNKVSEEDYLILKKNLDGTNDQFPIENRYKILDISNEAPDAIRFKYTTLGINSNSVDGVYEGILDDVPAGSSITPTGNEEGNGIYPNPNLRMDVIGNDTIQMDKSAFENNVSNATQTARNGASLIKGDDDAQNVDNVLYISWYGEVNGITQLSKKYRIANLRVSNTIVNAQYILKLEESILEIDANIAKHPTDTGLQPRLNETLSVKIERKDEKDLSEFSGRFFVKIVRDDTAGLQQETSDEGVAIFTAIAEANSYWFADDQTNATDTDFSLATAPSSTHTVATVTGGSASALTTTQAQWANLLSHAQANNARFFIDNMYFAAGQNSSNFYAKNAGEVVAGVRYIYAQQTWSNAIDTDRFVPPTQAGDYILNDGSVDTGGQLSSYDSDTNHDWQVDDDYPPSSTDRPTNKKLNYWPRVLSGQRDASNSGRVHVMETLIGLTLGDYYGNLVPGYDEFLEDADHGSNGYAKYYLTKDKATSRWKPFARDSERGWRETHSNFAPNINGWFARNNPLNADYSSAANSEYQIPGIQITASLQSAFNGVAGGTANCMEGIIVTDDAHTSSDSSLARRKWRQEGDLNTGSFSEANVYGSANGKVFLHLSYLAPGADLVPNTLDLSTCDAWGFNSIASHLQGIWGGGTFVADDHDNGTLLNNPANHNDGGSFIDSDTSGDRLVECEGNYVNSTPDNRPDGNYYTDTPAPGPGVGQGYDLAFSNLHYEQWDITDSADQQFASLLALNTEFQFDNDPDGIVYKINSISTRRMYNHTPWRKRKVWNGSNMSVDQGFVNGGDSVEEAAIAWARSKGTSDYGAKTIALQDKIKDFGRADNRRITFILELDVNPTQQNYNPIDGNSGLTASTNSKIQIMGADTLQLLGRVSSTPAIWETEPKSNLDLDVYYEASGIVPCDLNMKTREIFAPVGCKVEIVNFDGTKFSQARNGQLSISDDMILRLWDETEALQLTIIGRSNDGFNKFDSNGAAVDYNDKYIRFYRADGSYTTAQIESTPLTNNASYRTDFVVKNITNFEAGLSWYNCFSFGNGVESDRIRDDFNEMRITNGARASTTTEEPYEEDHRKYGLIFSGLYNSNSSLNELNQFIMAEKITKDINPTYGSIQKLFTRQTDLVTFCEDKVVKILSNKDAVFNADGNPQLTANINVLGQTIPFMGDYGISKNPESFAYSSYRAYFADKQRGAILRLSQDGLTPISDQGMHDWFRDNLKYASILLGSYDAYKRTYNITLKEAVFSNLIINSEISEGVNLEYIISDDIDYAETISGVGFDTASERFSTNGYQPWQDTEEHFVGSDINNNFATSIEIKEYPAISASQFQQARFAGEVLQASSGEVFAALAAGGVADQKRISVYAGFSNGFNNVTGAPSHLQDRLINGLSDLLNGHDVNGGHAAATGLDANIWHFGQGGSNLPVVSPSGGGISQDQWTTGTTGIGQNGICFHSYPDLGSSTPSFLDQDTSFVVVNKSYFDPTGARNDFFNGTDILDATTQSGVGLFENLLDGSPTTPRTIFNGEAISVKVEFKIPPYGYQDDTITSQGAEDTTNGPSVSNGLTDTPPDVNKPGSGVFKGLEVRLHEGFPAADGVSSLVDSSKIIVPDDSSGTPYDSTDGSHFVDGTHPEAWESGPIARTTATRGESSDTVNVLQSYPTGSTYFTDPTIFTGTYSEPSTPNAPPKMKSRFGFKFSDGSDNAAPIVNDLHVTLHPVFCDSNGDKYTDPKHHLGSIVVTDIQVIKRFRLESVGNPGVVVQQDIPALPANDIPAWTEVVIPTLPDGWSSSNLATTISAHGGVETDYFQIVNLQDTYGPSNPPTAMSGVNYSLDVSTGAVTSIGTFDWYEGATNGTTDYQDAIYDTPNYIYDVNTHTFTLQQILDSNGALVDFPKQPPIYSTLRINSIGLTGTPTLGGPLRLEKTFTNADTGNNLEVGAWYCVDVFPDTNGEYPETKGTWSSTGSGFIMASGVCNNNLIMDANDELHWGNGGSNTDTTRYPIGHFGRIKKRLFQGFPETDITLEYYKPNLETSTQSGGVWTLDDGTEANNINTNTYGPTWNNTDPSYRAIFNLHPNSTKATQHLNQIRFEFDNVLVDAKSICWTKIQNPTQTNAANDGYGNSQNASPSLIPSLSSTTPWLTHQWWRSIADGGSDFSGWQHGLKDPKCYYLEHASYGGLNFDGLAYHVSYDSNGFQEEPGVSAEWLYYFNDSAYMTASIHKAPTGLNSPQTSNEGWELAFQVNKGVDKFGVPRAAIHGGFSGRVTNKVGDAPNGIDFGGFEFDGIQHEGHYKITGNMNGLGPYSILYKDPSSTQYVDYISVQSDAECAPVGVLNTDLTLDADIFASQISFASNKAGDVAFVGAIKDITLKNNTDFFVGGSINAWSFYGFDTTQENFIFFDDQTDPQNPAIGFENAIGTNIIADRVQIQQVISSVVYNNETFLIEFEHNITSGEVEIYYFNANGKGFRIQNITGNAYYSQIHTIGEADIISPEFVNTFVIFASSGTVNGSIDNVRMTQTAVLAPRHTQSSPNDYPEALSPATLSYDESVKGWVSFKSYIPEHALSLSKKYYTIKNGTLYEHHAQSASRNTFYGDFTESSVTALLNQEPSTVKLFNTLGYEGTQSKIDQYVEQGELSNISTYNLQAKDGWYVNYIKTDKQRGSIPEFIEKEGKWFNYIKGALPEVNTTYDVDGNVTSTNYSVDTSEFSFQGLGTVKTIQ